MNAMYKAPSATTTASYLNRWIWGGGLLIITAIVCGSLFSIWSLRQHDVQSWKKQVGSMSYMLSSRSGQTLFSAYVVLDAVTERVQSLALEQPGSYLQRVSTKEMHGYLREKIQGHPEIDALSIVDSKGNVLNFSRFYPVTPPINLADRDYFQAHRASPSAGEFIGKTVRNKATGKWTFFLSRRINDATGKFMGVVLMPISVENFTKFYGRATESIGKGVVINLYRDDLTIMARAPIQNDLIGKANRQGGTAKALQLMQAQQRESAVVITNVARIASGERDDRIVATHKVGAYPLYLSLIISEKIYLANWRYLALLIGAFALVCSVLVFSALLILTRNLQKKAVVEEALISAKDAAESASKAKSLFLSSMSHELRTPLNAVLGHAQLLALELRDPDQQEQIDTIQKSGWHLLALIDQVLDLAKIEQGVANVNVEVVDLDSVLQECEAVCRPQLLERDMRLMLPQATTIQLHADKLRVKQCLLNYLSNAIKYGAAQSEISVTASPQKRVARILVRNVGEGLHAEQLDGLFKPFNRIGRERSTIHGVGLGLVITKQLIEQMGGQVGATCEVGRGCEFWFELPLAQADSDVPSLPDMPMNAGMPKQVGARLLFVEDNPANAKFIATLLTKLRPKFEVKIVSDAKAALQCATEYQPDLLLLDIHLPGMDGVELLMALRSRGIRAKAIALTAAAMPDDIARGKAAGFEDYLTKPIQVDKFLDALDRVLPVA